jgi:hypothetical protein
MSKPLFHFGRQLDSLAVNGELSLALVMDGARMFV